MHWQDAAWTSLVLLAWAPATLIVGWTRIQALCLVTRLSLLAPERVCQRGAD